MHRMLQRVIDAFNARSPRRSTFVWRCGNGLHDPVGELARARVLAPAIKTIAARDDRHRVVTGPGSGVWKAPSSGMVSVSMAISSVRIASILRKRATRSTAKGRFASPYNKEEIR